MKNPLANNVLVVLWLLLASLIPLNSLQAQSTEQAARSDRRGLERSRPNPTPRARLKPPPGDFYRFDERHWHYRYYPRFGYITPRIPDRRIRIVYRDRDYFFYGGVWYRPHGLDFEVIAPPIGIYVPVLPPYYTTIWIGGRPYYYANDVYYIWRSDRSRYQVVEAPNGVEQEDLPLAADELFIYPKEGQNETQIADDRYACHVWSRDQTQYDPTQPPTNLTTAELNAKRDNYQRAMRACLEGKGYSVR